MARREPTPTEQYLYALEDVAKALHDLGRQVLLQGRTDPDHVAGAVRVHDYVLQQVPHLGLGPLLRAAIRADHPEVVQQ